MTRPCRGLQLHCGTILIIYLRYVSAPQAMRWPDGRGQAQEAVARLLQLHPAFCISNLKDVLGPYRRTDLSRYEEGLRKAGLPE